jgi:hypothetical protein
VAATSAPSAHVWNILVPSAYAQTATPAGSGLSAFWKGFLLPLGYGKDEQKYRVIAASTPDRDDAQKKVDDFKKLGLDAFVGNPIPGNPNYAVVVSDYVFYPDAVKIRDQVNKLLSIDDAYLSPYAFR